VIFAIAAAKAQKNAFLGGSCSETEVSGQLQYRNVLSNYRVLANK
jgi:methylaspartate ammonia-lyase